MEREKKTENNLDPTLEVLIGHRLDRTISHPNNGTECDKGSFHCPIVSSDMKTHKHDAVPNHLGKLSFAIPGGSRASGRWQAGEGGKMG